MLDYKSTLTLKIEEKKNYLLLVFDGALDKAGLDEVRPQIEKAVEEAKVSVVALNLVNLSFINSESIGFLLTLHTRLVKKQKKLVLFGAAEHVLDVLNVIGMLKILESYSSEEEMLKHISS